jgi:hypothetical protein
MSAPATVIVIMCVVIVVSLATWLVALGLAARKPGYKHPRGEQLRGRVQGGMHVGGGRSVAPHRDETVTPDEPHSGDTLAPGTGEREPARRGSGNPMDL